MHEALGSILNTKKEKTKKLIKNILMPLLAMKEDIKSL